MVDGNFAQKETIMPSSQSRIRRNMTVDEINALADSIAAKQGVSPSLVKAVIKNESGYDPDAVSSKGAMGLMQLMPQTAARFGVTNAFDPEQNLRGGMTYLAWLIETQLGDVLDIVTPAEPAQRGAQLSLRVRAGRRAGQALFAYMSTHGVLGDWREPDVMRVAPAPLYNTFADCLRCVEAVQAWRRQHA